MESYNLQYAPLKPRQGELTDPLYFDFISFSQYATIAREMGKGRQVFEVGAANMLLQLCCVVLCCEAGAKEWSV